MSIEQHAQSAQDVQHTLPSPVMHESSEQVHDTPEHEPETVALFHLDHDFSRAPELPFAHSDSGNLITVRSLSEWISMIQFRAKERGWQYDLKILPGFKEKEKDGGDDTQEKVPYIPTALELMQEYFTLHFLSRSMAERGMHAIIADIKQHFDPRETVLLMTSGSSDYFYRQFLAPELADYSTARFSHAKKQMVIEKPGQYKRDVTEAENVLYIDDWVLSGQQLIEKVWGVVPAHQLFTYHLVASDRAEALYKEYHYRGKAMAKVIGDSGPQAFFGSYRVFGYHKIPDTLPSLFADSERNTVWMSIFDSHREYSPGPGRNARLGQY